jgi:GntR family transcriptional regulator
MPLRVQLDYDRGVPIYRQIYEAARAALASGALLRDEQLPTIHDLARQLEVNPNTVARAYRELERDGYIVGKRGLGTFPAERPPPPRRSDRTALLRSIFERAVADGARHDIGADEIVAYFLRRARP